MVVVWFDIGSGGGAVKLGASSQNVP